MNNQKYLKLVFEKGSVLFRNVNSYTGCDKTQLMVITFEDKSAVAMDMVYLIASMGELVKIKTNINNYNEKQVVTIIDDELTNEVR